MEWIGFVNNDEIAEEAGNRLNRRSRFRKRSQMTEKCQSNGNESF